MVGILFSVKHLFISSLAVIGELLGQCYWVVSPEYHLCQHFFLNVAMLLYPASLKENTIEVSSSIGGSFIEFCRVDIPVRLCTCGKCTQK